jgi:hypothetical protein
MASVMGCTMARRVGLSLMPTTTDAKQWMFRYCCIPLDRGLFIVSLSLRCYLTDDLEGTPKSYLLLVCLKSMWTELLLVMETMVL